VAATARTWWWVECALDELIAEGAGVLDGAPDAELGRRCCSPLVQPGLGVVYRHRQSAASWSWSYGLLFGLATGWWPPSPPSPVRTGSRHRAAVRTWIDQAGTLTATAPLMRPPQPRRP
jgi:hypothetical protein